MQPTLMLYAALAGAALPVQAAINAGLSRQGATTLWAAAISAGVTTLALVVIGSVVLRAPPPRASLLWQAPPWLWTGGLLGGIVLVALIIVAPRLGAAAMIASVVAGQMLCSLVLDHFGWLGLPQQPVSPGRLAGAAAICAGVALIRYA
jgi:transporter family-2 protein